jgi:hypothetical protein
VLAVIGEYRADGVELDGTMGKLLDVFDWDAVDVVGLQVAIRMLLLSWWCRRSNMQATWQIPSASSSLSANRSWANSQK